MTVVPLRDVHVGDVVIVGFVTATVGLRGGAVGGYQ